MRNGNNLCYAVSTFHLLEHVKVAGSLAFTLFYNHLFMLNRHMKIFIHLRPAVLPPMLWSNVL